MFLYLVSKCICENENGGGNRNTWLCEDDGKFKRSGGCNIDEWCVGTTAQNEATFDHKMLCSKGNSNKKIVCHPFCAKN